MSDSIDFRPPEWTLGWRLQRAFAHAGLTTEQVADEIGVSRSTVSRWLNEHGAGPKRGYLMAIAMRCGVPFDWLTGDSREGGQSGRLVRKSAFPVLARAAA